MKAINLSAVIGSIRAKVDKSISFTVNTPELSPEEVALFFQLQNVNLNLLITPTDEPEAPEYKVAHEVDQKTPSQRLRAVLYVLWQQNNEGMKNFENEFYPAKMNYIIEQFKKKLDQ